MVNDDERRSRELGEIKRLLGDALALLDSNAISLPAIHVQQALETIAADPSERS